MKTVLSIELNAQQLLADLRELEAFLNDNKSLKERNQVLPFFGSHPQLIGALGWMNAAAGRPDRYATELDLFGDFSCDAAAGDSAEGAFTLIEFEDAAEYSVFRAPEPGKSIRKWSARFERGFSQLVDWAWRLGTEGDSQARERIFGSQPVSVHLLLVVGRNTDLQDQDFRRMSWRSQNVRLGGHNMSCLTFDNILSTLKGRIMIAEVDPAPEDPSA
jgi:antiviral defense system Shedu protein SduA